MLKHIARLHASNVAPRRQQVLARHICELLPPDVSVLDVGCGDGALSRLVQDARPDVSVRGLEVLRRPREFIPVELFDGSRLPAGDGSVDVVLFVDVLHHTDAPEVLLAEARRVARRGLLIKDHTRESWWAGQRLKFMDWVGNRAHGVRLPYNYWPRARWEQAWRELGLRTVELRVSLELYPRWARPCFENGLHFMALLAVPE